jgi:hypothetical protein
MPRRLRGSSFVLVLSTLLLPHALFATLLWHYDTDSLAYMSTDVVIATVSVESPERLTATVTDVLYGALRPGDVLDKLSSSLRFFRPMNDGQRVVLFLSRRPRKSTIFDPGSSVSPFALVPSGVYLIDEYEHVHEYFQQMNPGGYVAEGYSVMDRRVPTKEQDLAFPALADVKKRIAASLKYVEPLRPLLDKVATPQDAPTLLSLLETSAKRRPGCGADAIVERLGDQLRSLKDPELALRTFAVAPDWRLPIEFVNTAGRVQYLIQTLSDRKQEIALRVAALEILLDVSRFHSGPQIGPSRSLPIDNQWLRDFAGEIQSTAKSIFVEDSENSRLRGMSLQFLAIDQPDTSSEVRKVYGRTASEEVRFAIEDLSLEVGDAAYEALNPPGGPVASLILVPASGGCVKARGDNVAFLMKYRRKTIVENGGSRGMPQMVLTDVRTQQRFIPKVESLSWSNGGDTGEMWFELTQPIDVPAGEYYLRPEWLRNAQAFSTGHRQAIAIVDTPGGRRVVVR